MTAIGVLAVLAAAAPVATADRTIKLGAQIEYDAHSQPGGGCNVVAFIRFPVVRGAGGREPAGITYTATYDDNGSPKSHSGPPFDDQFTAFDGSLYAAPAGEHQFSLSGLSGGGDCGALQSQFTNPGGTGHPRFTRADASATIPNDLFVLKGTVTTDANKPTPNVPVRVSGTDHTGAAVDVTVRTSKTGTYTLVLRKGRYTVRPSEAEFRPQQLTVQLEHDTGGVDFEAVNARDTIELHFSPASALANGTGVFTGSIGVVDFAGNPVAGKELRIAPPETGQPDALICSSSGRLWPSLLAGDVVNLPFTRATGGDGTVPLSVYVGSQSGDWFLGAEETEEATVTQGLSFPFTARDAAAFPTDPSAVPQAFYSLIRRDQNTAAAANVTRIRGIAGTQFARRDPASEQELLLAFLEESGRGTFGGSDFGPIHAADSSGVLFYPQGALQAGPTWVLDTDQAADIIRAAVNHDDFSTLPATDRNAPTLTQWEQLHATAALGHFRPVPDEQLSYFGYPYPPRLADGTIRYQFYNSCLKPDPQLMEVQVHSPLTLVLEAPGGQAIGLDSHRRAVGTAPGLVLGDARTHTTTYLVPSANYSVSLTGTGAGVARIAFMFARRGHEQLTSFALTVRKGQRGSIAFGDSGTGPTLRFAGKSFRATHGLTLVVHGLPRRARSGARLRLKLTVIDQFGNAVPGAQISLRSGGSAGSAETDARGRATITITAHKRSLRVTIISPGARTVHRTIGVS